MPCACLLLLAPSCPGEAPPRAAEQGRTANNLSLPEHPHSQPGPDRKLTARLPHPAERPDASDLLSNFHLVLIIKNERVSPSA